MRKYYLLVFSVPLLVINICNCKRHNIGINDIPVICGCIREVESANGEYHSKTFISVFNRFSDSIMVDFLVDAGNSQAAPEYSKDKKHIAYINNTSGNSEIWVYDIITKINKQITNDKIDKSLPSWNYIGDKIYFVEVVNKKKIIVYVDVKKGKVEKLISSFNNDVFDPVIAPGDSLLLYVLAKNDSARHSSIRCYNILSHNDDSLLSLKGFIRNPQISPDGERILFEFVHENTGDKSCLMIYNIGAKKLKQLTANQYFWGGCWAPNGKYVLALYGTNYGHAMREANSGTFINFVGTRRFVLIPEDSREIRYERMKNYNFKEILPNGGRLNGWWPKTFSW